MSDLDGPDLEYEPLDHTADAGLRLGAPTLPRLFAAAAAATVRLCCPDDPIEPRRERRLEATGADLIELLVDWLGEVNVAMQLHGELYGDFVIERLDQPPDVDATGAAGLPTPARTDAVDNASSAAPLRLRAVARGEPIDPSRHRIVREIKAVTYHQAQVRRDGPLWRLQVIFDL